MNRNLANLGIVVAILLFVIACVCPAGRDKGNSSTPTSSPTPSQTKSNSTPTNDNKTSPNKDEGDFKVEHSAAKSSKYTDLEKEIKDEKLLENAAAQLNKALALPENITLKVEECGEPNAFYDGNDVTITMCYELMEHFYLTFRSTGMQDQKAYGKMFAATRFVFLHEVGHALIDQYKLPVTGNEEDSADRLSAFINLEELGNEGVEACFAGADAFKISSKMAKTTSADMADEHLLDEQRSFNSLCMIYGSNSVKYANILTDGYLPKARAERCEQEYQRMSESWANLLKPWRKA
ncbi:MAG TPA: DUF4344 domain-containing metallopeptidase [Pyrinomonadaceae bacterium]|nr:DUF4344 domain-containing metallopeptidase [Pyrinomonadaceae bacterium]